LFEGVQKDFLLLDTVEMIKYRLNFSSRCIWDSFCSSKSSWVR